MNTQEIILDNFGPEGFYSTDPSRRAHTDGCCRYHKVTNAGVITMCALGRAMMEGEAERMESECPGSIGSVLSHLEYEELELDAILRPDMRGHSTEFWRELQDIHDLVENWDDDRLTSLGQRMVDAFLKAEAS